MLMLCWYCYYCTIDVDTAVDIEIKLILISKIILILILVSVSRFILMLISKLILILILISKLILISTLISILILTSASISIFPCSSSRACYRSCSFSCSCSRACSVSPFFLVDGCSTVPCCSLLLLRSFLYAGRRLLRNDQNEHPLFPSLLPPLPHTPQQSGT